MKHLVAVLTALLVLGLLVAFTLRPVPTEWAPVWQDETQTVEINLGELVAAEAVSATWMRVQYFQDRDHEGAPYDQIYAWVEVQCSSRKIRIEEAVKHDSKEGVPVASVNIGTNWVRPLPGGMSSSVIGGICSPQAGGLFRGSR
jgi:hypothetical protein